MLLFLSDELITAIKNDISESESKLDQTEMLKHKGDNFFANHTRDTTTASCSI